MSTKYTTEQVQLLTAHLLPLIHTAEQTANKFSGMKKSYVRKHIEGSINYWSNVASGLKWALEQAVAREERTPPKDADVQQDSKAGTANGC